MRALLILMMSLCLTACVNESATYYIDGRDHAISLRRQQAYFWHDQVTLTLVGVRLPDCQRRHELALAPISELAIELFATDDNLYTVRAGEAVWQINMETCELTQEPAAADLGERVGSFVLENGELAFVGTPAAQDAPAAAPPIE